MRGSRQSLFNTAIVLAAFVIGTVTLNMPCVQAAPDAAPVVQPPPAAATPGALPAGHPSMKDNDDAVSFHPKGMQAPKSGALRVIVTQGTKGAPAIGHDLVTVELFARGKAIRTYNLRVGDGGVVEIHDLPLEVPFQPVITVEHAGAPQELVGPPMHKFQPAIQLDMKVYETTTEKPVWTNGIRHVTAESVASHGTLTLRVTEMIGGFAAGDRTWTGDHNVTLTIPLPPNAQNVGLGQGLAEANPTLANGTVTCGKPLLPGSTEYVFGYTVPVTNGAAELSFTPPADTKLFALYIPATFHVDKSVGLTVKDASGQVGSQGRKLVVGKDLKAGQVVSVSLSGITPPPAPVAPTTLPDEGKTTLHLPQPAATKP